MSCFSHCVEKTKSSNVTVQERGRRANFSNDENKPYNKIKVDDCVIKKGARSDWIVEKIGYGSIIIELKGRDIERGWQQLKATFQAPECKEWLGAKVGFLIVCSKHPNIGPKRSRWEEEARRLGVRLKITSTQSEFRIECMI